MKVRVTVMSNIPSQREYTVNEVHGSILQDEIDDLYTEVRYLLEYELLRGKILGFSVMQVSKE